MIKNLCLDKKFKFQVNMKFICRKAGLEINTPTHVKNHLNTKQQSYLDLQFLRGDSSIREFPKNCHSP